MVGKITPVLRMPPAIHGHPLQGCSIGTALCAIAVTGALFSVVMLGSFQSDGKNISADSTTVLTFSSNLLELLKAIADVFA